MTLQTWRVIFFLILWLVDCFPPNLWCWCVFLIGSGIINSTIWSSGCGSACGLVSCVWSWSPQTPVSWCSTSPASRRRGFLLSSASSSSTTPLRKCSSWLTIIQSTQTSTWTWSRSTDATAVLQTVRRSSEREKNDTISLYLIIYIFINVINITPLFLSEKIS